MSAGSRDGLPIIRSAKPLRAYRIGVVWKDGRRGEVDLAPQILRYRLYRPLRRDSRLFESLSVVDGGIALAWLDGSLDISADTVAALERTQSMSAKEFRNRLDRLGLSFDAAAAAFDISRRQIAYYSAGDKPIPRHVVLALRGFEAEMGEGV